MINVCPVGRSCSQEERLEFSAFDQVYRTFVYTNALNQSCKAVVSIKHYNKHLVYMIKSKNNLD